MTPTHPDQPVTPSERTDNAVNIAVILSKRFPTTECPLILDIVRATLVEYDHLRKPTPSERALLDRMAKILRRRVGFGIRRSERDLLAEYERLRATEPEGGFGDLVPILVRKGTPIHIGGFPFELRADAEILGNVANFMEAIDAAITS